MFLVPFSRLFVAITLFGTQKVSAQEAINGCLVDEVEQSVVYDNVMLLSLPQGRVIGYVSF